MEFSLILPFLICCSGQLRIPSHISILHVEQEVTGDDTQALQSVLECDTKREELLKREKEITAAVNAGLVLIPIQFVLTY